MLLKWINQLSYLSNVEDIVQRVDLLYSIIQACIWLYGIVQHFHWSPYVTSSEGNK